MSGPDINLGIKTPIPGSGGAAGAGYVLGRTKTGTGDVHLIPIDEIAGAIGQRGSGVGGGGDTGGSGTPIIPDGDIMANISGSSAAAVGNTLTAILDHILGSSPGLMIIRGTAAWTTCNGMAPLTTGDTSPTAGPYPLVTSDGQFVMVVL